VAISLSYYVPLMPLCWNIAEADVIRRLMSAMQAAIARRTAATKLVMFTEWGTFRMPAPTRPPNAGKGRPRGVPNKMGRTLKEMILGALDDLGGQQWLAAQAQANPNAFLTLLGRVLPHTLATEPGEPPIVLRFSEPDRRL